ncbi:TetR/AcrR family transcriptional regulator [Paenibacillus sp. ACRSA]|uniref:TetR/AcrR family transcriptional regulator n=1 Tax=Paenibacillus sp. ACRSA TaxID=2918211 RepID=UPI001EF5BF29|nr:TetR/AcrR family transcriptional regulator [Paenibacillus sp. ACRSA]MCG7376520.1 TetR/AcrR family transcriptional regulator [Paenibacillus sp. ACRSA]
MMTDSVDKRILRSKTALKETFVRLLFLKPFQQLSISEIVREANYNRGTFYAHYATKDELLHEVIQDVLDEFIRQIQHPYQSISKVNLKEMQTDDITLFTYLKANAALYKLLLSDHIQVDFRYQIARAIENLFLSEYEYELDEGTLIDPKWLYIYRAHGVAGLLIRWIEEEFPTSPQYMSTQIVELMLLSTEVFHVKRERT